LGHFDLFGQALTGYLDENAFPSTWLTEFQLSLCSAYYLLLRRIFSEGRSHILSYFGFFCFSTFRANVSNPTIARIFALFLAM
jgi:hypothetical protein